MITESAIHSASTNSKILLTSARLEDAKNSVSE